MSGFVRPNWREIDVVDLTDAEVALMSDAEDRWCSDLLFQRWQSKQPAADVPAPEATAPLDIDSAKFAVMEDGRRIEIYSGEGANAECFAGVLINPTEREMRGNGHVSCLWDRSKVVRIEPALRTHILAEEQKP